MSRINILLVLAALSVWVAGLAGCSSSAPDATPPAEQSAEGNGDHADHGEEGHADADASSDMEKMKAELAKLSPEDAASAEKQHFCPVSNKMLGTMGPPQKVDVNGQTVWICCPHCKDALLENPDEYLAKLKQE